MFLVVDYGGTHQHSGELSQEMLQHAYDRPGMATHHKIYRLHEGRFQRLHAHKWRTAKEGGGWDENSDWKAGWDDVPNL